MRVQIRFFAIGLLTAALLIFLFYSITDESDAQIESIPVETLIAQVETDGYRVITEEEFIDYSFYKEEKNNEEDKSDNKNEVDEKDKKNNDTKKEDDENSEDVNEEEEEVTTVKLKVSQGDVSQDIAAVLEENDIIDNAFEFVQYLEDNDYSPYIQLGTFEITSDMTRKEIAETITTYPSS